MLSRPSRAAAAAGAFAILAAACSPTPAPVPVDPALVSAQVDADAGTIVLPLDRFALTEREAAEIFSAQNLAFATCVTAAGIATPESASTPDLGASRLYGVWYRPEVERYGYGLPDMQPAHTAGDDTSGPTSAELAVFDRCSGTDDVARFESAAIRPGFDYAEETTGMTDRVLADDEVEHVLEEWESCLAEVGLRRDQSRSPWAVAGTTTDPTEANIRTALLDLDCKDRVDYVARIAAVEAAVQAPIVQEHLAELQQMRAEYDAMLADARAYLGENAPG